MANQDAPFGLRPIGRIGGTHSMEAKIAIESPLTMEHQFSKVIW